MNNLAINIRLLITLPFIIDAIIKLLTVTTVIYVMEISSYYFWSYNRIAKTNLVKIAYLYRKFDSFYSTLW